MINPVINFSLKLIGVLGIVFGFHIAILHYLALPLFHNLIVQSYVVNIFMAIIIFGFLFFLQKKYLDILGFIFMAGSFLKFGVFFIFFNPIFKKSGDISSEEALSFLIPYLACLIVETFFLVKLLNK